MDRLGTTFFGLGVLGCVDERGADGGTSSVSSLWSSRFSLLVPILLGKVPNLAFRAEQPPSCSRFSVDRRISDSVESVDACRVLCLNGVVGRDRVGLMLLALGGPIGCPWMSFAGYLLTLTGVDMVLMCCGLSRLMTSAGGGGDGRILEYMRSWP